MTSHGYARVAPALAEYQGTLARGTIAGGTETAGDDAASHLLRFTDPVTRRTLAIRPDITQQVGRIAAGLLAAAPRPLRLCYAGQVMTMRPSGLNGARELLQVGAELIGRDNVAAAAEIASMAIDALDAAGIGPVSVDFTLPDAVARLAAGPLPVAGADVAALGAALDAKDAGALGAMGAGAYLPLLAATGDFAPALARLRAFDAGGVLTDQIDAVAAVAAALAGRATLTLDPTERRGFAYHSWFGFSLYLPGHGDAIGRGGSYVIARADGQREVAVGFSLYPDPLIAALVGQAPQAGARRIFLPLGHDPAAARALRGDGWQTVAALDAGDDGAVLGCGWVLRADGPEPL